MQRVSSSGKSANPVSVNLRRGVWRGLNTLLRAILQTGGSHPDGRGASLGEATPSPPILPGGASPHAPCAMYGRIPGSLQPGPPRKSGATQAQLPQDGGSCEIPHSLTILSVFVRACPCPSIPHPDRTGQRTHIARPSPRCALCVPGLDFPATFLSK